MAVGKVIKGEGFQDSAGAGSVLRAHRVGVVNAEEYDARQSAISIVEVAQRKAAEIVETAQSQSDEITSHAKEAGRQEGLASVVELMAKARIQSGETIARAEKDIITLACKIAEKIIGEDVQRSPELLATICATAIEHVRNVNAMVVRVSPRDAAILRTHRKQMMERIGRVKDIVVKEDADLASGGCIIETESGTVDAQLSTQFQMLQSLLTDDAAFAGEESNGD